VLGDELAHFRTDGRFWPVEVSVQSVFFRAGVWVDDCSEADLCAALKRRLWRRVGVGRNLPAVFAQSVFETIGRCGSCVVPYFAVGFSDMQEVKEALYVVVGDMAIVFVVECVGVRGGEVALYAAYYYSVSVAVFGEPMRCLCIRSGTPGRIRTRIRCPCA
jgi:hypothetical protein